MRRSKTPCPFKVGDRFRPIAMFDHHDYRDGETYTVVNIDPNDSTLRGTNSAGTKGNWIRWSDCAQVSVVGWEWLKGHLPADALELLSAFDGLDRLRLRPEARIALVNRVPSLRNRILDCLAQIEESRKP